MGGRGRKKTGRLTKGKWQRGGVNCSGGSNRDWGPGYVWLCGYVVVGVEKRKKGFRKGSWEEKKRLC